MVYVIYYTLLYNNKVYAPLATKTNVFNVC